MMSGFPANSVFIVDSEDRVRHQTVLDPRFQHFCSLGQMAQVQNMILMLGMILMLIVNPRVGWNMEEVARLVAAYRWIFSPFFATVGTLPVSGTLTEGRVLPWPAGRASRTPWTTR